MFSISRRICSARPSIASFLPAPPMIVVLSCRDDHLLGRAEVGELDRVELDAEVLEDGRWRRSAWRCRRAWPCGDRRSRAPSRHTRCRMPRSLLTTSVARASPSTSSAMISSGLPALRDRFQQRNQLLGVRDLFLVDQDQARSRIRRLIVLVRDEVRREEAAIELHALDDVDGRLVPACLPRP